MSFVWSKKVPICALAMKKRKISAQEHFLRRKLAKQAKRSLLGKKSLKNLSWLEFLPKDADWWRRWEATSSLINQKLISRKNGIAITTNKLRPLRMAFLAIANERTTSLSTLLQRRRIRGLDRPGRRIRKNRARKIH